MPNKLDGLYSEIAGGPIYELIISLIRFCQMQHTPEAIMKDFINKDGSIKFNKKKFVKIIENENDVIDAIFSLLYDLPDFVDKNDVKIKAKRGNPSFKESDDKLISEIINYVEKEKVSLEVAIDKHLHKASKRASKIEDASIYDRLYKQATKKIKQGLNNPFEGLINPQQIAKHNQYDSEQERLIDEYGPLLNWLQKHKKDLIAILSEN